jgi:aryl-alcohol dehydrogenase-like predicted oxidoreductase
MTFGSQTDQETAIKMVDLCLERDINFFDTANVYQTGKSEEFLGAALKGRRDRVVLASKVFGRMSDDPNDSGLSAKAIIKAVEDSLRRLQTDHIDLYYLHQPDYSVPITESLAALDKLVEQGKIRYPAVSNYSSWQTTQMLWHAEQNTRRPVVAAQQMYNLLARGLEQEFIPFAKEFDLSVIAYNPLAGGLLTGKHTSEKIAAGTRFDKNKMYQDRYWHTENFDAVEKLSEIAEEAGRSLLSLALNWVFHHPSIDCTILGASKIEQLEQNLDALNDGPLAEATNSRCDDVWKVIHGRSPVDNR